MILERLELVIEGLPPLNSSERLHWRKLVDHKRRWYAKVSSAVLVELGRWPAAPLALARVTITRCSSQEPDGDNLGFGAKFILDGLKRAGVILDDKPSVIGQPILRWEHAPAKSGHVRILVEAVEAESSDPMDVTGVVG